MSKVRKQQGKGRENIEQENNHQKQKQCNQNKLTEAIIIHEQKYKKNAEQKAGQTHETRPSIRAQNVNNTISKKSNLPITP